MSTNTVEMCSFSSQLARIMAILQQQRQQQGGVGGAAAGGGNPKLSPSHLGGGLSKQPLGDPLPHSGMGGALSDLHAKTQGMYSGRTNVKIIISFFSNLFSAILTTVERRD